MILYKRIELYQYKKEYKHIYIFVAITVVLCNKGKASQMKFVFCIKHRARLVIIWK